MRSAILFFLLCMHGSEAILGQSDDTVLRLAASNRYDSIVVWYRTISKEDSLRWLSPQALHLTAKALFYYGYNSESLSLYRMLTNRIVGDSGLYVSALLDYGLVLTESGQYSAADSVYRRVFKFLQSSGLNQQRGNYYNRLAVLRLRQSRYSEARQWLDSALAIALAMKDSTLCSAVYTHIGIVERETGFYGKALEAYRQAWILDSLRDHAYDIAANAMNMANIYNELGQFRKSLQYYEKAKLCYSRLRDTSGLAMVMANMATAYYDLGDRLSAIRSLEQARILDRGEDPLATAGIALNLGILKTHQGHYAESFFLFDSAIRIYRQLNRPIEEAYAVCFSGRGRAMNGWLTDAEKDFQKALHLIRHTETPETGWIVYYEYASMQYRQGEKNYALSLLDTAMQFIENLKIRSAKETLLSHYLENEFHQVYRLTAQILIEKQSVAEALQVVEKIKARSIQLSSDSFQHPVSSHTIFRYFYYDSLWYVFIIQPDTVAIQQLPSGASIAQLCADYYRLLVNGINDHRMKKISRQLYHCLIRPILNEIQNDKPVIVVPDGYLYYIPFETLMDEKGYLIERTPVRYLPSVQSESVFDQRHLALKQKKLNSFLFFRSDYRHFHNDRYGEGFSDLPAADLERKSIRKYFQGDSVCFIFDQVSENHVATLSGQSLDILHIASHAIHDVVYPDHSALVLGSSGQFNEDGYLTVEEINRLSFPVRLIVLSACETSLGELLAGEGMTGLTRAFLVAGAASVISTLWKIEDHSAAQLMERFYYYHKSLHLPASRALQKAKIDCLRSGVMDPTQWGAYVLWGTD